MIYADQRWIGDHGIGRFARRVLSSLDYHPISIESNPAAPADVWRLTRALRHLTKRDLFFSPGYSAPFSCKSPFVLTLHDLNHIDRPENSSMAKRLYYQGVLKRACHRAACILTVSEFSRNRILEWSGIPPDAVINVRIGVDPEYHAGVEPFDLPFPYLLCVSNRKGHKNEFRVVEAFATADLDPQLRLVFTGDPTAELTSHIERHRVTARVHFTGLISNARFPSLYRSAEALVFPSLYEGFGLPVVEAMACGTPVLTSDSTALPEAAGNAALLVDPRSVKQIKVAMQRITSDRDLRAQLRAKGIAQAAHFPWSNTTDAVVKILSEL